MSAIIKSRLSWELQSWKKYMWTMLKYQQKNQHHKRMKTTAYDLSSRSKSFGLVFRILGLMVEWSGEQPSTQFPSGTSVFRMCWPFRSKSSTFRVLGKPVFLLILFICPQFYFQNCGSNYRGKQNNFVTFSVSSLLFCQERTRSVRVSWFILSLYLDSDWSYLSRKYTNSIYYISRY